MAEIGDWITPSMPNNAYYGQTGQIIGLSNAGNYKVDFDGDGSHDINFNSNGNGFTMASYTAQNMILSDASDLVDDAIPVFNTVLTVILAAVALGIFINLAKRIKGR